jgi:hypothetical protein
MWTARALLLLAYTKNTMPLIGYSQNDSAFVCKAYREFRYKINRTTAAIGVIFSIYRKEDVLIQLKVRGASEKFKTSHGTYSGQLPSILSILSKSIS